MGQISTSFRWGPGLPGPPLAVPLTWEHNAAIESYRSGNTSELAKIHMKYSQNYLHNSESHLTMHRANGLANGNGLRVYRAIRMDYQAQGL